MNKCISLILFLFVFLASCTNSPTKKNNMNSHSHDHNHDHSHDLSRIDSHSYSEPTKAISEHLHLNLKADFKAKTLSGTVTHKIQNFGTDQIIFDVRGLDIKAVEIDSREQPVDFTFGELDEMLGQALIVPIDLNTKEVMISYSTTKDAAAVQWLDPVQTTDKEYPFLFTQGQAILTRTWIPCQDSPGIRVTYSAEMEVPKEMMAVMSAENPTKKSEDGKYTFEMKQAIPPYLIALAIGDLEFEAIGSRTGIYAEPSMVKKSVYEFADMEKMLEAAEALYGPYLWEQYDVIVLPASFPFGGMENPRLTFATPTILAGDRSLTALIAHELAHSWSGNLVTNATWDDFWLNEGFTVYFERRIMESLYGEDYVKMLTQLGIQDLNNEIKDLGNQSSDTHLKLSLKGRDPDDGMTDIAYEKGCLFLMAIEEELGREKFDVFLKKYFSDHKFQTLTTEEFIDYLTKTLLKPEKLKIDINEWIYKPGLPANRPQISSNKFELVEAYMNENLKTGTWNPLVTHDWTTHEWLHFIRSLPMDLSLDKSEKLDQIFAFSKSGNSEVIAAWLEGSINNGHYKKITPSLENFLVSVGRRKFLTPLYKALIAQNDLALAAEIYKKARPNYHSVSTQTMDDLIYKK